MRSPPSSPASALGGSLPHAAGLGPLLCVWLAALGLGLAACTSDDAGPAPDESVSDAGARSETGFDAAVPRPTPYEFPCLEPWEPTGTASYRAIFHEVLCTHGCTAPYCHGSRTASAGLSFETRDVGYAGLLRTLPDPQSVCGAQRRVQPGRPEQSLLYLKLANEAGCGSAMPLPESGWPALDTTELERVADWIRTGATDDSL